MSDESRDDPRQRTTAVPARRVLQAGLHPRAVLRVVMPSELARTIELGARPLVLGRQSEADGPPPLVHEAVSRRHFSIEWDAARGVHTGVDLGSSNGSFVDGQPTSAPLPIRRRCCWSARPAPARSCWPARSTA
jgi:FHA domain